jgi:hypothetical protein
MTAARGALALAVAVPAVTAGPLSMWTVLMLVGWIAVVGVVWLLLIAYGRTTPG